MSFQIHEDVFVNETNIKTQIIEGRLPMRLPAPNDAQWGSRQVRDLSPKQHRPKAGRAYYRVSMLLDRMRSCYFASKDRLRLLLEDHEMTTLVTVRFYGSGCASQSASKYNVSVGPEWMRPVLHMLRNNTGTVPSIEELHPSVRAALKLSNPRSVRVLLMHLPRMSKETNGMLIYNQTYDKLARGLYTRTTPGKYLRQHFPSLTDTEIRDIVALTCSDGDFGLVWTREQMIDVIEDGPQSCMRGFDRDAHPYSVYDPAMGWGMAYKTSTAFERSDKHAPKYYSRALVNTKNMTFVRSYRFGGVGAYSHACEALEAWLATQGYTKQSSWGGARIKRLPDGSGYGYVMPYVDGAQEIYGGAVDYFTIGRTSATPEQIGVANQTDGEMRTSENLAECEDCGDEYDEDDADVWRWAGRHENRRVCRHCIDNNYVYGYGRNGYQYYFHSDVARYCESDGEHYHEDYLADNDIVECYDTNDLYPEDETFKCEYDGNYYNDGVSHVVLSRYSCVHYDNADAYFSDNLDDFVTWWAAGCARNGDDVDVDELARTFVDSVHDESVELCGLKDFLVYRDCCAHLAVEPQLVGIDDDDAEEAEETN